MSRSKKIKKGGTKNEKNKKETLSTKNQQRY